MNSLERIIKSNRIVLFFWGPLGRADKPSSTRASSALKGSGIPCAEIDISCLDDLRKEIREFSGHETFPQLFVEGEFVGGYFLIPELIASGELERVVGREALMPERLSVNQGQSFAPKHLQPSAVWSLKFSCNNEFYVMGSADRVVTIGDPDTLSPVHRLIGHEGWVNAVSISPNSELIASGSADTTIRLWSKSGDLIRSLNGHSRWVNGLFFLSDHQLLSVSADGTIRLWDVYSGKQIAVRQCHDGCIWSVAASPDGSYAITGGADKRVRIWSLPDLVDSGTLVGHGNTISSVCAKGSSTFLSSSLDGTVIEWSHEGRILCIFRDHSCKIWNISSSEKGDMFVSVGADRKAVMRSAEGTKRTYSFEEPLTACAMSTAGLNTIVGDLTGRLSRVG